MSTSLPPYQKPSLLDIDRDPVLPSSTTKTEHNQKPSLPENRHPSLLPFLEDPVLSLQLNTILLRIEQIIDAVDVTRDSPPSPALRAKLSVLPDADEVLHFQSDDPKPPDLVEDPQHILSSDGETLSSPAEDEPGLSIVKTTAPQLSPVPRNPHLPDKLHGKPLHLLDTGCTNSILSKTMFDRLPATIRSQLQPS